MADLAATPPIVRDDADRQRFEVIVGDAVAGFVAYQPGRPDEVVLVHTEVDDAFAGQGLGSVLVGGALAELRRRGLAVDPVCPFVRRYLTRHPDELELVRVDLLVRRGLVTEG